MKNLKKLTFYAILVSSFNLANLPITNANEFYVNTSVDIAASTS